MLWSLAKVLLFVALTAALTIGASRLMDMGGELRVALAGWEFTLGPLQGLIAILVLVLALWLLFRIAGFLIALLRFIAGDETALSRHFDRNRERRGYAAVQESLLALASGEGRVALARAAKAERFLDQPQLTNLLVAQAAEMSGDRDRAKTAWKALLEDDRSRFVGVRGLLRVKLDEGDTETALKLAEKAFALKPAHPETQDILLQLQAGAKDWKGARATLEAKRRAGALPRDIYRRRDAVLALQEARDVIDEGKDIEAREAAIAANRQSPDLIPAAAMAARSYIAKGDTRHAARVLRKAWEAQPHPDLAAAFAEIAPDETPQDRQRRFAKLTDINPGHPETRMLMAELAIAAEDFPAARRALGDLVQAEPTARALTIMAAIERGEGADDAVVRGWLARALTAPRGKQWVCEKCHNIHAEWQPVCDNCGAFDTLAWTTPPEGAGPSPTQTEMLPLIVGRPDSTAATVDAEVVEDAPPDSGARGAL
ncbi:heme biosynthesis protein HemY [Ruixingdingia sedimenti]|uniref:Heme biosynthesis HemY N-terminal domain-containing protein n=1 Tax=Ruixingdingia sedimenti TaxID=3073604 RepID=A0ABU1F6H7_9RHOB|nr:heme biosynthesis HemY N-terminal domain-containing protein [Xinfangfangia sp. LG-4]MDR5652482.1 heme biosynthesis HemY N-terminal domain-containing protein [Xinfangfangia sp. LG-4]